MRKIIISIVFISSFMFADFFDDGVKAYSTKEYTKASKLFGKACDGGHVGGCTSLGVMYYNGQGVKQDYFKAVDLYKKACDGGHSSGCTNYAILNKKGH